MVVHRVGVAVGGGLLARQAQRATDLHLRVLLKNCEKSFINPVRKK